MESLTTTAAPVAYAKPAYLRPCGATLACVSAGGIGHGASSSAPAPGHAYSVERRAILLHREPCGSRPAPTVGNRDGRADRPVERPGTGWGTPEIAAAAVYVCLTN